MTCVISSGGLKVTGIIPFSGDSRSATILSVSSPRRSPILGSSFVSCKSSNHVSFIVPQRLLTIDLHRNSSSLSPQASLSILTPGEQTTDVSGAPHVTRRSELKARYLKWRSSPRITTTISVPAGLRSESLSCGSGEIRRATVAYAPSLKDIALSHGDYGEIITPYFETPCLFSGGYPFNSGENPNCLNFSIKRLRLSMPRVVILWAWPFLSNEAVKLPVSPPNIKPMFMVSDYLICVAKMQRTSGGFIGDFDASLLSYSLFLKNALVLRALFSSVSFMRNVSPSNTKWRCVSLSINVLLSYVAVRSGPEDATDIVSIILRGADWILT